MPKLKIDEAGFLWKHERQKLQRLYTQGAATYGSVRNLVLYATWLADYQYQRWDSFYIQRLLKQNLLSQHENSREWGLLLDSEMKFGAWILAYVDKLAKENNGVKYLLVRQDLFDRTVNAKGMKTKDSQETVKPFSSNFLEGNRPQKIWVDKGTEYAGAFRKSFAAEGIQVYSTMSETKAAFAELTIRSLKNYFYRYMEDFGYKYIHKLPQYILTLNSRINSLIDMRPKTVKNCDLMSILYSKPLREYKKHTFKTGNRVGISKHDLPFRKGYKPQCTREVFEFVAIATRTPPTYTIKDEQEEIIKGKFYQKELIKVFQQWTRLQ